MTRVFTQKEAKKLGLPGRNSLEMVSGESGAKSVTLRVVEIPVPNPGDTIRGPHMHRHCEECIFVLSGQGTTHADSGEYAIKRGDAILISAGESHVTRNTGTEPLVLLCFFPAANISAAMQENLPLSKAPQNS
ncbi:MAG TPA: cupin domain-containing protein [Terriglobales bacterium]|nr:cupin domain-containing protein [Terriglobales bacterium]